MLYKCLKGAEQISYKDSQYLFFSSYMFSACEYFMRVRTRLFSVDEHLVDMYIEPQGWRWKIFHNQTSILFFEAGSLDQSRAYQ